MSLPPNLEPPSMKISQRTWYNLFFKKYTHLTEISQPNSVSF